MYIILAGVISLIVTLIAGKLLIPALVKLKAGQSIKEIGPTWHMNKQGTPTMGGLMFIIGIGVAILAAGWPEMLEGRFTHLYVYAFALVFGVIGYIDDYQKVKHHQNTGLTAPQKFILQLAAAVAFLCLMRYEGMLSPNLYIPFFNTHIVMNWVVYMIFAAFVIVGTVNAVNITDGLDGLSSSVTLPVALFFAVMGAVWGGFTQLGVFAGAMFGGLLGVGLGKSRQKFLYLPEEHNDCIFAVVCEELGLIGACVVMLLFALLILRGFWIALHAKDRFGTLMVVGIMTLISLQTFLNIAVVTGLIPATGISLPFFSYGGTALALQLFEMGIVLSVSRQIPAPRNG